jgi:hypothetical protein
VDTVTFRQLTLIKHLSFTHISGSMLNPKLFWACPFEKEMEEVSLEHDSPSLDVICLLTSGYGPWVLAPLIINGHSITLVGYDDP